MSGTGSSGGNDGSGKKPPGGGFFGDDPGAAQGWPMPKAPAKPEPQAPAQTRPGTRPGPPGRGMPRRPGMGGRRPPPRPGQKPARGDGRTGPGPEESTASGQVTDVTRVPDLEKKLQSSSFNTDRREQELAAKLGRDRDPRLDAPDESEEPTLAGLDIDGESVIEELTVRDLFKRIVPPVQNREGKRNPELYRQVLDQFAPGGNPRYDPDPPDRSRGHIFAWDVSRALNCELPHFMGARELNLGQTCDWLRELGPTNGWRKVDLRRALEAVSLGMPVLAVPKDPKVRQVAVLRPGGPDATGQPRVAAVAFARGHDLSLQEALGTVNVEFFHHV